jgi:hypothetical protein
VLTRGKVAVGIRGAVRASREAVLGWDRHSDGARSPAFVTCMIVSTASSGTELLARTRANCGCRRQTPFVPMKKSPAENACDRIKSRTIRSATGRSGSIRS